MQRSTREHRRRKARIAATLVTITASICTVQTLWNRLHPEPYHNSRLSGVAWLDELELGHRDRMLNNLGLRPLVFNRLEHQLIRRGGLSPRRWVGTREQLGIFLYQVVTNSSVRKTAERFQRSFETISRSFRAVLQAFLSPDFRTAYMTLPNEDRVPERIRNDPKLWPFFKDAIGAIDGSHLFVNPPSLTKGRWRDRSGNLTQNMLAACDFDMFFVYVLAGWEGSAADSYVYQHATHSGGFHIPAGKYYLADAGFPSCDALLVPYRNIRYHLREWQSGNLRPQTKEELFNLRHAQLRNVIERIFGVLKREFRMAREPNEYSIDIQVKIPVALTLLHNFLRINDPDRFSSQLKLSTQNEPAMDVHGDTIVVPVANINNGVDEGDDDGPASRRDQIASAMWDQYQATLEQRRLRRVDTI
ncbi:hypothetical protein ONZ45_g13315 [Pleurotus djamor]|nr:hypothetical protein ONZ45_g13315 [Pleurotus djamor]